ncbi:MAG: DMT family transporter [Candidatus Nanopelagicales bacterium]|nr:DMT family transporter [Candidatus Nanopelagicales bacterium]MCU0622061.1 DMT family transporter [Gemmatimonadales bacterium]
MSTVAPAPLARPPVTDLWLLAVAVMAISTSGPLIAACTAPALAIAFWRTALGSAATWVWVGARHRSEVQVLDRLAWRRMAWAGVLLGAHFATWVPSLRFTTVASSTALVATQPVWAALIARRRGAAIPRRAWIGIGTALVGILVLTGVDFALTPRALIGDALALAGAVLAALYVTVGEQVRTTTSNATYTAIAYAAAGLALLALVLVLGVPLVGFTVRDWLLILAITVGAQLLGHTVVNRVLATTSATVVSLAILFEMPGSTLIAAAWLGQVPPWQVIPAVVLLFAGIALVIGTTTRPTDPPSETPPA